jgi:hypothetical protein
MDDISVGSVESEGAVKKEGKGKEYMSMGIHPLVKVFSVGEEVSDCIRVTRDMFENEIKVLEKLHPLGLATSDFLWLVEVL